MDNIERSEVTFNVDDLSNATDVVTTSDISEVTGFVFDPFDDLILFKIELDGITLVDFWVWESDGSGVVGDDVWDFVGTNSFG
jgi:hypothetical protein